MKIPLFLLLGLLAFSLRAQAPAAVEIASEPHHHLVLENSYVRVWRFGLPAGDSTLLHAHTVPYIAVALGAADFANDVAGKAEVRGKTVDGQVNYSRGGFAHLVKADAGVPFDNVTVELLRPQGEPRNFCERIVDGPVKDCSSDSSKVPADSPLRIVADATAVKPLLQTDDFLLAGFSFAWKNGYTDSGPQPARLLIVCSNSELQVEIPGEATKSVHGGEVLWIEAGKKATILTPGEHHVTRFFILSFKDGDVAKP